jgi:hypothetical protein
VKGESAAEDVAKNQMVEEASRLSIEPTSLSELLDLMGYKGRAKSISFTGAIRADDFAPKPKDGVIRESTGSTSFRDRIPLRRRDQPSRTSY